MSARLASLFCLVLVATLVACGSDSDGGNTVAPVPVAEVPPPAAGVVGDGRLNTLLEWARAKEGVPALAMVLVHRGQVFETGAVGRRSVDDTTSVSGDDRWHLGSLTKALTATLAAVLVEQSVIGWDTRPLDVWPELDAVVHPALRQVTLKQLLSHTAGLVRPDVLPLSIEDDAPGDTVAKRRAWAAELLATAPAASVGRFRYSNGGYVVAGAMLETITNTPWELLIQNHIFAPLGMTESAFGAPGNTMSMNQPRGHWDRGTGFEAVEPGPDADNPQVLGPAGTVHTTLADYAQFMLAHLAGARGVPNLVTADTFEVLHSPVDAGSALGWGFSADEDWAEGPALSHAGSNVRWYAVVRLAPALDAGALFVVNAGGTRAEAAIGALGELVLERFANSR